MDFPLFHLDLIGNRMLVALTAIIHVIVNHPMAVGAVPLVTLLEFIAHKTQNKKLDELAYKFTFVFFIITTSLGALTGVGIWFTTALVNPDAIGSLLRIFFWAWFFEWIVFVIEVCMIMVYFLTWKNMQGEKKMKHIWIGVFLAMFSWITMAVITAVLGFMMNSGDWLPFIREWTDKSGLITAIFNPLYVPQLAFRTPIALMSAGLFFMFLTPFFVKKDEKVRYDVIKYLSAWVLVLLPAVAAAAYWYWTRIPAFMVDNFPVAVTTQNYTDWYQTIVYILAAMVGTVALVSFVGIVRSKWVPRVIMLVPFLAAVALLGYFERVREFVRKPYIIEDYMYANGLKVENYALYKEDGVLPHATFVKHKEVTEENKLEAGKDVFMIACSRCHTIGGINSVESKFEYLFPDREWQKEQLSAFIKNMHNVRVFMPPFPGNDAELEALTEFILQTKKSGIRVEGAQSAGFENKN